MAADGTKLPGFFIFVGMPGKTIAKRELPQLNRLEREHAVFAVQKNAWCDEQLMLQWVDMIWDPFTKQKNRRCILLLDAAYAHHTQAVKEKFASMGTILISLPPGETSKVQVLDVGINRPFKEKVRELVTEHNQNNATTIGRSEMAEVVINAWKTIRRETIVNTYRHIGITN